MSFFDGTILVVGAIGAIVTGGSNPLLGIGIVFVVSHFFLFCNVFRVGRALELAWAAFFLGMMFGTTVLGTPPWWASAIGTLCFTAIVIAIEMRKPSYHGVFWEKINPGLRDWWRQQ